MRKIQFALSLACSMAAGVCLAQDASQSPALPSRSPQPAGLASPNSASEIFPNFVSSPSAITPEVSGGSATNVSATAATEGQQQAAADAPSSAISANPAAVNVVAGTGKLGELLGFDKESGVRLGGLWIGDANAVPIGGIEPGQWGLNSATLVELNLDSDKLVGLKGGLFGAAFVQFAGQRTNELAGTALGYDSLPGSPPLVRQELYELWWRQALFEDRLTIRVGKQVPTFDFNNVSRPILGAGDVAAIPSVTGLNYSPIFVNPTIQGFLPTFYNSVTGVATTVTPNRHTYISYGFYDGNLATGSQTGLKGPEFNGYYFHIGEVGYSYALGPQEKRGRVAIGFWGQTGKLTAANLAQVNGAQGVYAFSTQRLWLRNPGVDNSGVVGFVQVGANNTNALPVRQFWGAGLTAFGLVAHRKDDSFGCGLAWGFMNTDPNAGAFFFPAAGPGTSLRSNELMLQSYYQMNVRSGIYFQPTLTYIPNPGQRPNIDSALAVTMQLTVLF